MMEIQQHDGVVVDVAGYRQGFAERLHERERCSRGERGAKMQGCGCPLPPLIYIGSPRGAPALGDWIS